jgi:Activator of Hsp90 ATPase homolog 1-like protein
MTAAVIVSIRVGATPLRAFETFTAEIGSWWRQNPLFALTPRGDGELRFEPGEGGRLVAMLANGREFEVGRIIIWKPGERLALTWRQATFAPGQSTELDVRFEAMGDETRVTVEHRGWDEIPRDHVARHGFELMLFQRRLAEHWRMLLSALDAQARRDDTTNC